MKKRTYKETQDLIFAEFGRRGWEQSSPYLKMRWVQKNGIRIWFKPQALYAGTTSKFKDARSITVVDGCRSLDLRKINVKLYVRHIEYFYNHRSDTLSQA